MEKESKKGIGKFKISLVISISVIVVLAGLNIWFYMDRQSLELQIDDLRNNYDSEQWWNSYYQNLSDQLSTEKANLQNQVNILTTERDNLQNQVNSLTSQVATLQIQYDTLNTSCYKALMGFSSLQTQYGALNASYYEALADIASLQTDLTNMTNWKNSLLAQIADLEDQIDDLNTIIAQKDATIAEKNATIDDLEARTGELVCVLNDDEYYPSIKGDLENATETILVAMYPMIYDPDDSFDWANDLIRELVNAKERGVDVTVIIEYRTYFDYMDDNLDAYQYLSANNVTVQLDNENDTDHMKLVIIDDRIVYVGSHNWSESALYNNHETSVKIVSEDIAETFKTYFETI